LPVYAEGGGDISAMSLGPKRQLAAVQRYGRCRWNTGLSVDAAHAAGPRADPVLINLRHLAARWSSDA
jgi:hypothetical protein